MAIDSRKERKQMCFFRNCLLMLCGCLVALVANTAHAAASANYQVQIVAPEMCCQGCVQKVSAQLYAAPGVISVEANLDSRTVVVTVSRKKGATIEQLWQAVVAGKGGPTKLTTANATFTLVPPANGKSLPASTSHVVVENLNQEGRAQKIAKQLYATPGVQKVGIDVQQNALIVTGDPISPWALIGAVTTAQARPLAVRGSYGEMTIAWNQNQQANQFSHGGIQR
jgi:copper chaperone CopZ